MLAPLLLLWPMSVAVTWLVAQTIANRPYDRELGDVALAVARQAAQQVAPNGRAAAAVRGELERTAAGMLRADDEDQLYFQVLGRRGEFVAGDPALSVPPEADQLSPGVRFRDDLIGDEPVRVAYVRVLTPGGEVQRPGEGGAALVQVAETLNKRSRLATEIIKGVILPQFVILPLAVVLVWLALSRGIQPLNELQQRIRRRESTDLSPITDHGVPDEVVPLVRAINDLLARLDRSMATQKHFLADAAHQLKTPLAGLRMQAELVAREIEGGRADPASVMHSLRQIALSSQRAAHLVNQLLAMARAEDTGQALRRVPVDLAAVTRAVVLDFVPLALDRGIDLGYEGPGALVAAGAVGPDRPPINLDDTLPTHRLADTATGTWAAHDDFLADVPDERPTGSLPRQLLAEPVLVGEMVRNLVDNALHYTPRGGSVTVRVLPDPFGQVVVLQVEDTGPGVDPAERERVFQPFYRALGTQVEGSGLGLAIVQEIAVRHGGEVSLADVHPRGAGSGVAPGALFTVRLPLVPVAVAVPA
jgi:two-component system sensor histidine kinase TctE